MIPKIIHYCWFGGNPLPESAQQCIQSWKRLMPDYEIKEWNETNFDVHCCQYVEQAYEQKKWAFVSDYARFWILYKEGGIYFDTDVELIQDLEPLLKRGPFLGVEKGKTNMVNPGLGMAAPLAMPFYQEILDDYQKDSFINEDGSLNLTTVVMRTSELLQRHGFQISKLKEPCQIAGIWIYPEEYFCPMDYYTGEVNITKRTYSIHKYDGSWTSQKQQDKNQLKYKYYKCISAVMPKSMAYPASEILAALVFSYQKEGIAGVVQKIMNHYLNTSR